MARNRSDRRFDGGYMAHDTSVPAHEIDLASLSPRLQAEHERWTRIGDQLAESWKRCSTARAVGMIRQDVLAEWKQNLTGEAAIHYVHAFASSLCSTLLDCYSPSQGSSEGYLIVVQDAPIQAEFQVPKDSRMSKNNQDSDAFVQFEENHFFHTLRTYCGDEYAPLAVPHIAESLRTRELAELAKLDLTDISPSIIKVTLEEMADDIL